MAFQARLQQKYKDSVRSALSSEFGIKNPMLIPALEKIVISVGAGDSAKDQKTLQNNVYNASEKCYTIINHTILLSPGVNHYARFRRDRRRQTT